MSEEEILILVNEFNKIHKSQNKKSTSKNKLIWYKNQWINIGEFFKIKQSK